MRVDGQFGRNQINWKTLIENDRPGDICVHTYIHQDLVSNTRSGLEAVTRLSFSRLKHIQICE